MLDVDGTLIKYDYLAVPSDNVIAAVKKAQEELKKEFNAEVR